MSDHAVMPYQHYKNACDAIRAKGAGSASIKSGDMAAAINSISSGALTQPDISFTKITGCPPFAQKDGDYFGDDIRSYLTDRLGQSGDLLLTVVVYFVPTIYSINIPSVAKSRYNSNKGSISILCALSTPRMISLLTSEPANDFTSSGELFFFRIRGCQLYQSFINSTMLIDSTNNVTVKSDDTNAPRAASFGFAISSTATDMLTCSTNVADNDVLKHSFTTMEFDINDKHVRYAFFSAVKQRTTPGNDTMILTIKNPGSGEYGFMQTGVFYS
jgi:hypothetical protein